MKYKHYNSFNPDFTPLESIETDSDGEVILLTRFDANGNKIYRKTNKFIEYKIYGDNIPNVMFYLSVYIPDKTFNWTKKLYFDPIELPSCSVGESFFSKRLLNQKCMRQNIYGDVEYLDAYGREFKHVEPNGSVCKSKYFNYQENVRPTSYPFVGLWEVERIVDNHVKNSTYFNKTYSMCQIDSVYNEIMQDYKLNHIEICNAKLKQLNDKIAITFPDIIDEFDVLAHYPLIDTKSSSYYPSSFNPSKWII